MNLNANKISEMLGKYPIPNDTILDIFAYVASLESRVQSEGRPPEKQSALSIARKERLLSQEELASRAGISRQHLAALESSTEARIRVSLQTAVNLSKVLAVPIYEIFPEMERSLTNF